jgi:hypothetical protein
MHPGLITVSALSSERATHHPTPPDFRRRFPSPFSSSSIPARHRHHDCTERRKLFTITLKSCSRPRENRVHAALEAVTTMSHHAPQRMTVESERRFHAIVNAV